MSRKDANSKGFFPLRKAPFRSRVRGAFFSLLPKRRPVPHLHPEHGGAPPPPDTGDPRLFSLADPELDVLAYERCLVQGGQGRSENDVEWYAYTVWAAIVLGLAIVGVCL